MNINWRPQSIIFLFGLLLLIFIGVSLFLFFRSKLDTEVNSPFFDKNGINQPVSQSGPVTLINNNSQVSVSFFINQPLKIQRTIELINQNHNNKLQPYTNIDFSIESTIPDFAITESWASGETTYPYSAVSAQVEGNIIKVRTFVDPKVMVQNGWNSFMIQEHLESKFISGLLQVVDPDLTVLEKNRINIETELKKEFDEPLFNVLIHE